MARWKLASKHYLNVPGTEWEYKEVDRNTGKQKRVVFSVPRFLDPEDPTDWTIVMGRDAGQIIVCSPGKGEPNDITFLGDPTPDMIPMDEEAKDLTAKMAPKWNRPFEKIEGQSYAEDILDDLTKQVADVRSQQSQGTVKGMEELLTAMAAMMKQNQELIGALVASKVGEPKVEAPAKVAAGGRRV